MRNLRTLHVIVFLTVSSWMQGATGVFKEFALASPNGSPSAIGVYYGYVVYTDGVGNKIVRVRPDGSVVEYAIPTSNASPAGISVDYLGSAWFTEYAGNKIGKLSPEGTFTEYSIPTPGSGPLGIIASYPDVWFTEFLGNKIGRISQDGTITETAIPTANSGPTGVTAGFDGYDLAVFTERNANRIGKLSQDGSIKEFLIPTSASQPMGITGGSDGYYFTEFAGNKIGRAEFGSFSITEYALPTPGSGPRGIALRLGHGQVWFTEELGNRIGRLSAGGAEIAEFAVPTTDSHPTDLVAPADYLNGYLWFVEQDGKKIGRVVEDVIVIAAAASSGTWDTRVQLANSEAVERFINVGEFFLPYTGPSPSAAPPCSSGGIGLGLAPNGSASDSLGGHGCQFFAPLLVSDPDSGVLPSVKAQVFNTSLASQSADLPAVRLSRIAALDPQTLTFPLSATAGTKANLFLSDVSLQDSLSVSVAAYSSQGDLMASASASAVAGAVMILPVLSYLGLSDLDGQIRVTKVSGTGWMWGTLVTVSPDGAMSASLGTNP